MSQSENRTVLVDSTGRQLVVAEKTSLQITALIKDETGAVIAAAALTTLTLTLCNRDDAAKTFLNSVSAVNILNAGRGTVHATSGLVTILLQPADNAIVDATQDLEWHRALIEWTYNIGAKAGRQEIDFAVRNLNKVS